MSVVSLDDLYHRELQDLYSAKQQITHALPRMIRAARSLRLRSALADHVDRSEEQLSRLDEICERLAVKPATAKSKSVAGLLGQGTEWLREAMDPAVRDAALITSAQRIQQYEIAACRTVRDYAELLDDAASIALLEQTLDEEAEARRRLDKIARDEVHTRALEARAAPCSTERASSH